MAKGAILLSLLLAGCPWISAEQHQQRLDVDGDGYPWPEDCSEGDPAVHPGATEVCDGKDDNCDGKVDNDAADALTFFRDADGDGYGVESDTVQACTAPEGYADKDGDCDDSTADAHPGLAEVCGDHLDNDCDGTSNGCDFSGTLPLAEADLVGTGATSGDYYGAALAVGDLGGGHDLVVGAQRAVVDTIQGGAVYVHFAPLPANPDADGAGAIRLSGDVAGDSVGQSVAVLGDVDGDGKGDLLVGASGYNGYTGAAFLLRGGSWAAGSISQGQIGVGPIANARYGTMVAALGDVNGDERADFAVLAAGYTGTPAVRGAVYLFRGPAVSLDATAATAVLQHATCDPSSVAGVGDVDGDGVADVLVGAGNCDQVRPDGGEAWLLSGDLTGTIALEDAKARFLPDADGMLLGFSVAAAGDVDGDGKADVLLGAPLFKLPEDTNYRGAAYLFTGAPHGAIDVGDATARIIGDPDMPIVGYSVAGVGDVNADGYDDILVGAPNYQVEGNVVGAAFLYYGPVTGDKTLADADAVFVGPGPTSLAGYAVAAAGDVNEDGYADLLVGDLGTSTPGRLYAYFGRGR